MNRFIYINLCMFLIFLLTACQTTPKPSPAPEPVAEVKDPDIVVMSGTNGKAGNGLLGVKPMTFEELKSCAIKIGQLHEESSRLKIEYKHQEKLKQELDVRNKEVDADRTKINARNFLEVSKFNKRVEGIRELISQLDTRIQKYNTDVESNNLLSNQFNIGCANRSYRQSDMNKLPVELILSLQTISKESNVPLIDEGAEGFTTTPNGSIHLRSSH